MSALVFESLVILILILANGVLAMSETAMISARKSRLQHQAEEGSAGARSALAVAESPGRFLSTVQIGITLIGVLAGAFGGATLARTLAGGLRQIAPLAPYSGVLSVALIVLAITYLSLVIGELVPKRLALNNPERVASAVAIPMQRLSALTSPIVRLLTFSTDVVLRLLRVRPSGEPPVTEQEIQIMMEQGTAAGVFEAAEQDMVQRVFRMGEQRIEGLMTPRTEIDWLDVSDPPAEIQRRLAESPHSVFPVARENLDHVLGIVQARDLLALCLKAQALDVTAAARPPLFVPESATALEVLERFRSSRSTAGLVIDEFGGVQGLVTMTDLLEAIVGDLPAAGRLDEPMVVQREDGSWLLDGLLPVEELKEVLGLDRLPGEAEGLYQTLGGLMMAQLGRIPSVTDGFAYGGFRFEVLDLDGHRVDRVLVAREGDRDPA